MNSRFLLNGVFAVVLTVGASGMADHESLDNKQAKSVEPEILQIKPDTKLERITEQIKRDEDKRLEVISHKLSKEEEDKFFAESDKHLAVELEDKINGEVVDQRDEKGASRDEKSTSREEEKLIDSVIAEKDLYRIVTDDDKRLVESDDDAIKNGKDEEAVAVAVVKEVDNAKDETAKAETDKQDSFNIHLEDHPKEG